MLPRHASVVPLLAATLLAILMAPVAVRAGGPDAACKPVIDANFKQYMTPSHVIESGTDAGELIFIGNAIYLKDGGKWMRAPMTPASFQQQLQEEIHGASVFSCRYLHDDVQDGEATEVYSVQIVNDGTKFDLQEWISKSHALLLKKQGTTDAGGVKSTISSRYDYTDVQAPAGVQ